VKSWKGSRLYKTFIVHIIREDLQVLEARFDRSKSLQDNALLHSLPRCVQWFKALKETNLDLLQNEEFVQLISTGPKHFPLQV